MTGVITKLRYKTLEEAAEELGITQDKVLRFVEEEHLLLYVRTKPHGIYRNWRVSKKHWHQVEGDLSGIQRVPSELASELLPGGFRQIEVKAVILKEKHKVGLSTDGDDMFPVLRKKDVHLRQEDIEKCMIGICKTKSLNDLAVGPGSDNQPVMLNGEKTQDIRPEGGDRLTEKLYGYANEVGIKNVDAKGFKDWLSKNYTDFDTAHGSITYRQGNREWAEVNDDQLRARIYRLRHLLAR